MKKGAVQTQTCRIEHSQYSSESNGKCRQPGNGIRCNRDPKRFIAG